MQTQTHKHMCNAISNTIARPNGQTRARHMHARARATAAADRHTAQCPAKPPKRFANTRAAGQAAAAAAVARARGAAVLVGCKQWRAQTIQTSDAQLSTLNAPNSAAATQTQPLLRNRPAAPHVSPKPKATAHGGGGPRNCPTGSCGDRTRPTRRNGLRGRRQRSGAENRAWGEAELPAAPRGGPKAAADAGSAVASAAERERANDMPCPKGAAVCTRNTAYGKSRKSWA